jgi:hypothetical protein
MLPFKYTLKRKLKETGMTIILENSKGVYPKVNTRIYMDRFLMLLHAIAVFAFFAFFWNVMAQGIMPARNQERNNN